MLGLILISSMCEKDNDKTNFSGIVITDEYGNAVREYGKEDGDWEFNDEFNTEELRLFDPDFNTVSNYFSWSEGEGYSEDSYLSAWAWPNPTENDLTMQMVTGQTAGSKMKIVIVDNNYNSLANFEFQKSLPIVTVTIKLSEINAIEPDKIHRIYYMLKVDDSNTYYGHGDFVLTDSKIDWLQSH